MPLDCSVNPTPALPRLAPIDRSQLVLRTVDAMNADPSYFFVSALPNRVRIITPDILARDWHTIAAPEGHSFLISDCPVVTYKMQERRIFTGAGFGDENTIILLPVSPNHLFVASPRHGGWPTVFSASDMQYVNRMIAQFAHRNVYANAESEEVQRLVDTEIDAKQFGENAFVPPARQATARRDRPERQT